MLAFSLAGDVGSSFGIFADATVPSYADGIDYGRVVGIQNDRQQLNENTDLIFRTWVDPDALPQDPLPATLPLCCTGLGIMGIIGWRRKRRMAAEAA